MKIKIPAATGINRENIKIIKIKVILFIFDVILVALSKKEVPNGSSMGENLFIVIFNLFNI